MTAALLLLAFWLAAWAPVGVDAETHLAGLVIDYGDGTVTYATVPFDEETIDGIELLRASGLSLVSIPFGGLGEGVCSIEGHGCGVADCRRLCQTSEPNSPFWHYYVLGPDGWELQNRGASGTDVLPGDIQGWSWTGDDPDLPDVAFEVLRERSGFEEGLDTAASRTVDAAGIVVTPASSSAPWQTYGATALILVVLICAVLLAARRRQTSRSQI
ncbi:MAG: hypothetical protein KF883_14925 [Thermomicrobiales bacterium]|nr:hypothetical protein [Thermomicrobiales bacterium]